MGGTVGGSKGVQLEVFGEPQWEEQLEVPRGAVGSFW